MVCAEQGLAVAPLEQMWFALCFSPYDLSWPGPGMRFAAGGVLCMALALGQLLATADSSGALCCERGWEVEIAKCCILGADRKSSWGGTVRAGLEATSCRIGSGVPTGHCSLSAGGVCPLDLPPQPGGSPPSSREVWCSLQGCFSCRGPSCGCPESGWGPPLGVLKGTHTDCATVNPFCPGLSCVLVCPVPVLAGSAQGGHGEVPSARAWPSPAVAAGFAVRCAAPPGAWYRCCPCDTSAG